MSDDDDPEIVVCIKGHTFKAFSDLPIDVGSRWLATDPAVMKRPKNFARSVVRPVGEQGPEMVTLPAGSQIVKVGD